MISLVTSLAILFGFAAGAALYFLPLIISLRRGGTSKVGVGLVNLFFGWTVLGWVAALIWAYTDRTQNQIERELEQQRQMTQILANQNRNPS